MAGREWEQRETGSEKFSELEKGEAIARVAKAIPNAAKTRKPPRTHTRGMPPTAFAEKMRASVRLDAQESIFVTACQQ